MGVSDQKLNTGTFGEDIKKPDRSLTISKKNLFFIMFAVITLQVADTVMIWLMGTRNNSSSAFSGDSFMFSAVIFGILKCVYDKCNPKCGKVKDDEEPTQNEEEDCRKTATCVVDTMKVKGPPPSFKANSKKQNPKPGCEATIWVSSWWRPQCLNPKAKKFTPIRTYRASTLKSEAPVFMPHAFAKKEEELLKSQSGESETGEVVYRSNHWLNEIGGLKKSSPSPDPNSSRFAKPPQLQKAKKSQPKKWVPKPSA